MKMYRPPSKRRQLIQRTVVYGAMSLSVVALVTVLVFIMLGYQLNRNDGKIEQGGLVQFDSHPSGVTVAIDGMAFGSRTPSKTTMTAGQHYIAMTRSGYNKWEKSVSVFPGSVLWLNYTRLVPNELKPASVATFPVVTSTAVSPDSKWMVLKDDPATPVIHLTDLSQEAIKITNVELPASSYAQPDVGKTQTFTFEKWDADSKYVLMKHTYNDSKVEWLVVDPHAPAQTKNLTAVFNMDISRLVFSGNNGTILYAQTGMDIRKVDLGAMSISRPLISNVAEFGLYDNSTLTYTTLIDPTTKKRSVGYYDDGSKKQYTLRTYSDDGVTPLRFVLGKYFGDMYEIIAHGDAVDIFKGDLPSEAKPSSLNTVMRMNVPGGVQHLAAVTEGRFIVAQNEGTYHVYDLELKKATSTTLKGTSPVSRELRWLDSYMVWSDRDNMLRLYEFDGANQHDVMPVVSGLSATLSPNSKYIYGITKTADGLYHLDRVQMILS